LFATALAINSGSPGPSIAALVSRVLQSGWRSVLPFLTAMWLGEALWLIAAILGLSALAQSFHPAFIALKYAGIAYLLYLAWRMWNAPVDPQGESLPVTDSNWKLFASGMAITLGNPKIMVFYLALLPGLISVTTIGTGGLIVLIVVLLVVLAVIDLSWVAAASLARNFMRRPGAVRATNKISAGLMAGAALVIATRN